MAELVPFETEERPGRRRVRVDVIFGKSAQNFQTRAFHDLEEGERLVSADYKSSGHGWFLCLIIEGPVPEDA